MGEMERKSAKRKRRADIEKIVLQTVAAAGVLSVILIAPNVLGAMAKMGLVPKPRQKDIIKRARARLVKKGLLTYEDGKLRLTECGSVELMLRSAGDKTHKRARWDKRWRVVIFDIPESRKKTRQSIRMMLRKIGFHCLQHSVWIYPYNCEDLITLLKADARVGKDVLYMIVDTLENDAHLREHFGLPTRK